MALRTPANPGIVVSFALLAVLTPVPLAGAASATPVAPPIDPPSGPDEGGNTPEPAPNTPTAASPSTDTPATTPGHPDAPRRGSGDGGGGGIGNILGGIGKWFEGVLSALANPLKAFQDAAGTFLQLLVDRPVPTRNGHPAWVDRPDGALMGTVYDLTWTKTVPAAIVLTALYAGLAVGMRGLVPVSVVPDREATAAVWKTLGTAIHVVLGWTIMVGWAVLVDAIASWFLPDGTAVMPGGQSILEQVVAGGIGGIILWVSSGILAVLVVIVWVLSWIGTLLAPPAYPLLVAANPPDAPLLRKVRLLPDEGIVVALVAMPVPTAVILGLGYPAINAFRSASTGAVGSLIGIGLLPLLTLGMWVVALVAPLVMLWKSWNMEPVTMVAAAALGAASAVSVRDKLRGRRDLLPSAPGLGGVGGAAGTGTGGVGRTIDPVEGSPFQRSTDGGFGGALGGGGATAATPLGAGNGGAGASTGASGVATRGGGRSADSTTGRTSSRESSTAVQSVEEIPEGQRYEIGFEMSDGSWQPVKDRTFSREWLFEEDAAFSQIEDALDADQLYARGVQDAETYDIQDDLADDWPSKTDSST